MLLLSLTLLRRPVGRGRGMATLAASNVAALLMGYPVWQKPDISAFLGEDPPKAAPSIVNAKDLDIPIYDNSKDKNVKQCLKYRGANKKNILFPIHQKGFCDLG